MPSESARMTTAAEARFRVQAPNSWPRSVKAIALDAAGSAVVEGLAGMGWQHAAFFTARLPDGLRDLTGRGRAIDDEVGTADLVVLLAGPGGHAHAASIVGQACSQRRVMTTGFLVGAAVASERDIATTLAQLRPWSLMVVIANDDDYLVDMMTALRA